MILTYREAASGARTSDIRFASSEHGTMSYRPQLTLTYKIERPPVVLSDIRLNDGENVTKEGLVPGGAASLLASAYCNSDETENAVMAVAFFKNGRLMNAVGLKAYTFPPGASADLRADFTVPGDYTPEDYVIEVYLWDSIASQNEIYKGEVI
jgi:hypothetical protein